MRIAVARSVVAVVGVVAALVVVAQPAAALHSVTSVAPNVLGQNAGAQTLTVTGTGFSSIGGAPAVTVSGSGVSVQSTTLDSPTQLTVELTVAPDAAAGARTVTVSQGVAGIDTDDCVGCLTITAGPTISAFSPPGGSNTGVAPVLATLTVTGAGFQPGATLLLRHVGFDDIVASGVTVNGAGTSISGSVDLTGQPGGRWIIVVTNPDAGTGTFGDGTTTGFLISGSTPTVTSVTPSTRSAGSSDGVVTITGTNFARGAELSFGAGVAVTDSTWLSLTSYEATLDVDGGATPGARDVVLTNFDSQASAPCACFAVTAPPTVTAIDPDDRGQGAADQDLVITGSGFLATPTVAISGTGVAVDAVVLDSPTQLTVTVTIAGDATTGERTVTVTNPDGGSDTVAFTVNPRPTVTDVTPASRGQNAASQDIVVTGTNFVDEPVVLVSGIGVTVDDVTFDSPTQLTVQVTVAPDAPATARDVTVVNPDEGRFTAEDALTVTLGPTISGLDPDALARGVTDATVVVSGGGFADTPTVSFSGAGVTVGSVTFDSANQLTLEVSVAADADLTSRDLTVTNPDAGTVTVVGALDVHAAPTVTEVDPPSLGQGATADVTITGTGFQDGATATFGAGVTVNDVTFVDATELTANVTVAPGATPGPRVVAVANPDLGQGTCACFDVAAGPSITSITPSAGANSGTATITNLAGSGFATNAVVQLERDGFDPVPLDGAVVSEGGTKITGTFDLSPAGAPPTAPGVWTVRVTNPDDGGTDVLEDGFTVTGAAPTVAGVDPASAPQGSTPTVTVNGSGFADGAVVTVSGSGVTVGATTVTSATTIEVELTVAADAATGARDVTVTNADDQAASCVGCLTIAAAPTLTSVVPSSRGQGASNQNLVLTGAGFVGEPTVGFSGAGITVNSVVRDSATQLTVNVSVSPTATVEARDVTVTNPDGGADTLIGGFTVNARPNVTSVVPALVGQGVTTSVTVNGTGFASNPTVTVSGTGVTVNSVTRDSDIKLTVSITVASNAPTGARNVTVTNPDAGTGTGTALLTVVSAPTITAISPARLLRGATRSMTITGSGFSATPTVTFGSVGVTAQNVTFVNSTRVDVTVSVAPGATLGPTSVTVTNPDGGQATAPNGVVITAVLPVLYRGGTWLFRAELTSGGAQFALNYGNSSYVPVTGDWNGDVARTMGVYDPGTGTWHLRNQFTAGAPDLSLAYGGGRYVPVAGDWNGDGIDTVGVYDPVTGDWYLRNSNTAGPPNIAVRYGGGSYVPVVGDWNGDGIDTIGVYDPAGTFHLRNANTAGPPNINAPYGGGPGAQPVIGDWNVDGKDTIGITQNGTWYLANATNGSPGQTIFAYGVAGDIPLAWS